MKYSVFDNILIGFFILIFIISIYALTIELNSQPRLKQANDIGIIKEIKNSAKKRNNSMMTWHNISEQDAIQEDDIIFTNDKSSVLLAFNDGSLLNIESDSLIRLKDFKSSLGVVLEKGEIQINNQNKVDIELSKKNDQKMSIDKNSIFRLVKHNSDFEINSISGKAQFENSATNTTEISNGQNVTIKNNKMTETVSLIKITESYIKDKAIYLEWDNNPQIKNFIVQVSDDFSFKTPYEVPFATSPLNIPWNKPFAYIKILAINDKKTPPQYVLKKIYEKNNKTRASESSKDQDFFPKLVKLFNKMLENTKQQKR